VTVRERKNLVLYSFKDVQPNEWNGYVVARKELIIDRDGWYWMGEVLRFRQWWRWSCDCTSCRPVRSDVSGKVVPLYSRIKKRFFFYFYLARMAIIRNI